MSRALLVRNTPGGRKWESRRHVGADGSHTLPAGGLGLQGEATQARGIRRVHNR